MDDKKHNFGIESYKQIRAEVGVLLARIENLFRYSLLASSAVFAWVLSQAFSTDAKAAMCIKLPRSALYIAWGIPPALVLLSAVIALATYIRIGQMSGFLLQCEKTLGDPGLSWEDYLKSKPPLFAYMTAFAWLLMLAAAGYATHIGLAISHAPYCAK